MKLCVTFLCKFHLDPNLNDVLINNARCLCACIFIELCHIQLYLVIICYAFGISVVAVFSRVNFFLVQLFFKPLSRQFNLARKNYLHFPSLAESVLVNDSTGYNYCFCEHLHEGKGKDEQKKCSSRNIDIILTN